jgi:hypothetical protein
MKKLKKFLPLLCFSIPLLAGSGCIWVSSETAAMRDAALGHIHGGANKKFELSIGRIAFFAAGVASKYVQIPSEARDVLDAVKGGEVSIYTLPHGVKADRAGVLESADHEMQDRGWMRLVGVLDHHELVAIYVPEKSSSTTRACVLVLSEHELVCVSAACQLEPLMDLAMRKAHGQLALSE